MSSDSTTTATKPVLPDEASTAGPGVAESGVVSSPEEENKKEEGEVVASSGEGVKVVIDSPPKPESATATAASASTVSVSAAEQQKAASKMNAKAAAFVPSFGAAPFTPTANSATTGSSPEGKQQKFPKQGQQQQPAAAGGGGTTTAGAGATTSGAGVSFIPGLPGFPMPFMPAGIPSMQSSGGSNNKPHHQGSDSTSFPHGTMQAQPRSAAEKKEALEAPVTSARLKLLEDDLRRQGLNTADIDEHFQSVFCYLHQENMLTLSSYQMLDQLLPAGTIPTTTNSKETSSTGKDASAATPATPAIAPATVAGGGDSAATAVAATTPPAAPTGAAPPSKPRIERISIGPFWSDFTVNDFHVMAEVILAVEECRAEEEAEHSKKKGAPPGGKKGSAVAAATHQNDDDDADSDPEAEWRQIEPAEWVDVVIYKEENLPTPLVECYCEKVLPRIQSSPKVERKAHQVLIDEMYTHRHQRLYAASQYLGDDIAQTPVAGHNLKHPPHSHGSLLYLNETTRQEVSEAIGYMLMVFYTTMRVSLMPRTTQRDIARIENLRERLYACPGSKSFIRWFLPLTMAAELSQTSITKARRRAETLVANAPADATIKISSTPNVAFKVCDVKTMFAKMAPKVVMAFIALPPRCSAARFSDAMRDQFKDARPVLDATLGDLVYGYPRWKEQLFSDSTSTVLFLASRPAARVPAVAPPKVQAILNLDTKHRLKQPRGTLAIPQPLLSASDAGPRPQFQPPQQILAMQAAAAAAAATVKIGLSTHKARPLAETTFMADVKNQIKLGLLTREGALIFALAGIAESEELATSTLTKAIFSLETVVIEGIWTPFEEICNLPPPPGVVNFFDVVHTYLMPRDHIHKRLVRHAAKSVTFRVRHHNQALAVASSGHRSGSTGNSLGGAGSSLLPLGMNVGVWGTSSGGSTW